MTQNIPILTDRSFRQLKGAVHQQRDFPGVMRQRQRKTYDQEIPPSVIFKIPSGGIAAFDGTTVTDEACDIYKMKDDGTLEQLSGQRALYNFSRVELQEDEYVIGVADAYGRYIYGDVGLGQVLIKAPSGGIPQRVGTLLGSATCDVYGANSSGVISDTTENITVWNWGTTAACANGDRYGWAEYRHPIWYVVSEDCGDEGTQFSASLSLNPADTGESDDFSTTTAGSLFVTPRFVVYTPPVGVVPA